MTGITDIALMPAKGKSKILVKRAKKPSSGVLGQSESIFATSGLTLEKILSPGKEEIHLDEVFNALRERYQQIKER